MLVVQKLWTWISSNQIAQAFGALVLALIGWNVVKKNIQETGRIKERERIAAAQAHEYAKTVETVNAVAQETERARDQAITARDAVVDVSSVDELRARYPDNANIILRPRQAGNGQGS